MPRRFQVEKETKMLGHYCKGTREGSAPKGIIYLEIQCAVEMFALPQGVGQAGFTQARRHQNFLRQHPLELRKTPFLENKI